MSKKKEKILKKLKRMCWIGKDFLAISKAAITTNFKIIDRIGYLDIVLTSSFTGVVYIKKNNIIVFYKNGRIHRKGGPAVIGINKRIRTWYKDGFVHRKNKPATIYYDKKFNVVQEQYYKDNKLHNENGPAVIDYKSNSAEPIVAYYLDGVEISPREHYFRCLPPFNNTIQTITNAPIENIIQ